MPASLSGIISAVLLGFGRVIGETMVVLLCAGNRIAIPDFTEGLGAFFQPVHTMTGIIAQEMGEVVHGSIHYRALFMVGIVLFLLSLADQLPRAAHRASLSHFDRMSHERTSTSPILFQAAFARPHAAESVAFGLFRTATYFVLLCAALIFGIIIFKGRAHGFPGAGPVHQCALF